MGGVNAVLGQDVIDMAVEETVPELMADTKPLKALAPDMCRIENAENVPVTRRGVRHSDLSLRKDPANGAGSKA